MANENPKESFENLQRAIARGAGTTGSTAKTRTTGNTARTTTTSSSAGSRTTGSTTGTRAASSSAGTRTTGNAALTRTTGSTTGVRTAGSTTGTRTAGNATTARSTGTLNGVRPTGSSTGSRNTDSMPRSRGNGTSCEVREASKPAVDNVSEEFPAAPKPRKKSSRRKKPKKWYQKRKNQLLMKLGAVALVALLILILLITGIVKLIKGRSSSKEELVSTSVVSEEVTDQLQTKQSESPDGTGSAGIMEVPSDRAENAAAMNGWHDNGLGKIWYSMENAYIYYNGWQEIDGQKYHFTSDGYADRGWVLVGEQSCYFDNQGVYCPNQDNSKLVAFTFDDGPSQGMDEILALCEETGARVTFFMIGVQVENGGAVIPHIMADRCELGNHSYTHGYQMDKTTEECVADFQKCDDFIASFSGGPVSTVVRFPYGDFNPEQPGAVGKANIFWNIDSLDWDLLDADLIYEQTMPKITEGDIILMHDRHEATVEACRRMFPELIAQGYQIVTVSELAAAKGYRLEGGKTYYSFCDEELESGTAIRSSNE